jgi:predicted ATPase
MAAMIEQLVVDGFRRLCHVDLEMRPLGVVIGPNGSGFGLRPR